LSGESELEVGNAAGAGPSSPAEASSDGEGVWALMESKIVPNQPIVTATNNFFIRASRSLIWLLRNRRAELTVESVIGLFAGDFQLPVGKIFSGVAAIAPALKHEKVFSSGSDSGLKTARPVNLSLKTPFFIKHWLGVPGFCPPIVNIGCKSKYFGWQR
jgi:hypothetical protein